MKQKNPHRIVEKETPEERSLNEAIDRVYEKYGTDLNAFFRDVYKEMTIERQERGEARDSPQCKV
jgi:hypothetical protein